MTEEYLMKVGYKLLGDNAEQLWSVSLMSIEELDKECGGELWGNTRYWQIHNCSEISLADSFQGKKLPDGFIMRTYIHELAHVQLNAQGNPDHRHGKEFNRVHKQLREIAKQKRMRYHNWRWPRRRQPAVIYLTAPAQEHVRQVNEQKPCIEQSV
jgi:hypothetical protein